MTLIGLLIAIIIIGVVFWCAKQLIAAFQIPEPIATVLIVLLVLVALGMLLGQYTGRLNLRIY